MKKWRLLILLNILLIVSCVNQNNIMIIIPDPDSAAIAPSAQSIINIERVIETKGGPGISNMPLWLRAYIDGGISEIEKLEGYANKYVFLGINRGRNFTVLNRWADNYSERHDFPALAAARIERRMASSATLFPDDEYGPFFESMVKAAYNAEYPETAKEDVFWVRVWFEDETTWEYKENYFFFVLITVNKQEMQALIRNMIISIRDASSATVAQSNSVNRLRLTFFVGF